MEDNAALAPQGMAEAYAGTHELLAGEKHEERLGQWYATAISGNDITSSCLYVAGIATVYAHALAPVALILVAGMLYLYRKIYTEVVEALPLNGGIYNCLLNCTRKFSASMAACLTILSYLATAVLSAKTGAEYLETLFPSLLPMGTTTVVLIAFACLTILGITESARVALGIFILNLATLALFAVWGTLSAMQSDTGALSLNWSLLQQNGDWPKSLFLGFSAALLGVSGFESSANYVEQQRPGVFRLTLRNMWVAVSVINPIIVLVALSIATVPEIVGAKEDLLAQLGLRVGGPVLHTIIVVDAFLVLSGAVLTSYVGITGLVHRMTQDQCFPGFLLKTNKRGTHHRIILIFMALCISILFLTRGNVLSLAGVYTISFLGVMTLFGIGNILLKVNRKELKRTYRASWMVVILGVLATSIGIIGNIVIDYRFVLYFAVYFLPAVFVVSIMFWRVSIFKAALVLINEIFERIFVWRSQIIDWITDITNLRIVLFIRGGKLPRLVKAFDYIETNELGKQIFVFHLYTVKDPAEEERIQSSLKIVQELYPDLHIEYQSREGGFNPHTTDIISMELGVPKNMMFIGAPEAKHSFSVQDLGGVRVIF